MELADYLSLGYALAVRFWGISDNICFFYILDGLFKDSACAMTPLLL